MLTVEYTGQFKKDYKRAVKRGCSIAAFEKVVLMLMERKKLPPEYHDHKLTNSKDFKICGNVILNRIGCFFIRSLKKD